MHDETLLAILYRGRPATIAELATLTHLEEGAARAAVADLRTRGLLGGDGDTLQYPNPALWAAQVVSERSAELRRRSSEALLAVEQVVTGLPEMLRHWSVGETSDDPVPVVTRHGLHASEDLWFDSVRRDGGTLDAVLQPSSECSTTGHPVSNTGCWMPRRAGSGSTGTTSPSRSSGERADPRV